MAQDQAASGVELPELMTTCRRKRSRMPVRSTEREAAGRGAVARYYQESCGLGSAQSRPIEFTSWWYKPRRKLLLRVTVSYLQL